MIKRENGEKCLVFAEPVLILTADNVIFIVAGYLALARREKAVYTSTAFLKCLSWQAAETLFSMCLKLTRDAFNFVLKLFRLHLWHEGAGRSPPIELCY